MKKISTALLLLISTSESFSQNVIEIPTEKLKINYQEGDSIFINQINYFEYEKDNYLIDSIVVKNGTIQFTKKQNEQVLLMFTNKKELPLTYLPLRKLR